MLLILPLRLGSHVSYKDYQVNFSMSDGKHYRGAVIPRKVLV